MRSLLSVALLACAAVPAVGQNYYSVASGVPVTAVPLTYPARAAYFAPGGPGSMAYSTPGFPGQAMPQVSPSFSAMMPSSYAVPPQGYSAPSFMPQSQYVPGPSQYSYQPRETYPTQAQPYSQAQMTYSAPSYAAPGYSVAAQAYSPSATWAPQGMSAGYSARNYSQAQTLTLPTYQAQSYSPQSQYVPATSQFVFQPRGGYQMQLQSSQPSYSAPSYGVQSYATPSQSQMVQAQRYSPVLPQPAMVAVVSRPGRGPMTVTQLFPVQRSTTPTYSQPSIPVTMVR